LMLYLHPGNTCVCSLEHGKGAAAAVARWHALHKDQVRGVVHARVEAGRGKG
jgi:hypothetical protein